jgi:antitoxin MazE
MKTTLQRWGNSQGIRIPKQLVDEIGVGVGSELRIRLSEDREGITIAPLRDSRPVRGRHRIEDLIAASRSDSFEGREHWKQSQGKEVW